MAAVDHFQTRDPWFSLYNSQSFHQTFFFTSLLWISKSIVDEIGWNPALESLFAPVWCKSMWREPVCDEDWGQKPRGVSGCGLEPKGAADGGFSVQDWDSFCGTFSGFSAGVLNKSYLDILLVFSDCGGRLQGDANTHTHSPSHKHKHTHTLPHTNTNTHIKCQQKHILKKCV